MTRDEVSQLILTSMEIGYPLSRDLATPAIDDRALPAAAFSITSRRRYP